MEPSELSANSALVVRVVEDSFDVADWLAFILRDEGMIVLETRSRFDELLHAELWRDVDVAVVDLVLDERTSGYDVLSYLTDALPRVRRVCFTAYVERLASLDGLVDAVVEKPATVETLMSAIAG